MHYFFEFLHEKVSTALLYVLSEHCVVFAQLQKTQTVVLNQTYCTLRPFGLTCCQAARLDVVGIGELLMYINFSYIYEHSGVDSITLILPLGFALPLMAHHGLSPTAH